MDRRTPISCKTTSRIGFRDTRGTFGCKISISTVLGLQRRGRGYKKARHILANSDKRRRAGRRYPCVKEIEDSMPVSKDDAVHSTESAGESPKHDILLKRFLPRQKPMWCEMRCSKQTAKKPTTKKKTSVSDQEGRSKHVHSFSERSILRSLQHDKILNAENESRSGHKNAHIVQDHFANWIQICPMKAKDTLGTMSSLQRFLPPSPQMEKICTDNSKEFTKACQDPQWKHDTSTFHRSQKEQNCRKIFPKT